MYKTVFIGNEDFISGFRALSFETFSIEGNEVLSKIHECIKAGSNVIFVSEQAGANFSDEIEKINSSENVNIVILPTSDESEFTLKYLGKISERAAGVNLVK